MKTTLKSKLLLGILTDQALFSFSAFGNTRNGVVITSSHSGVRYDKKGKPIVYAFNESSNNRKPQLNDRRLKKAVKTLDLIYIQ